MAKQRLFPEHTDDDETKPEERMESLATKVLSVPKSEIDKREERWKNQRPTPPKRG